MVNPKETELHHTNIGSKCTDTNGERGWRMNGEIEIHTYTLLMLCIKWITNEMRTYCRAQGTVLSALW